MKITGTDELRFFKASIIAEKYEIDIAKAKVLKLSLEVDVGEEQAKRLIKDGMAIKNAVVIKRSTEKKEGGK